MARKGRSKLGEEPRSGFFDWIETSPGRVDPRTGKFIPATALPPGQAKGVFDWVETSPGRVDPRTGKLVSPASREREAAAASPFGRPPRGGEYGPGAFMPAMSGPLAAPEATRAVSAFIYDTPAYAPVILRAMAESLPAMPDNLQGLIRDRLHEAAFLADEASEGFLPPADSTAAAEFVVGEIRMDPSAVAAIGDALLSEIRNVGLGLERRGSADLALKWAPVIRALEEPLL